MNEPEKCPGHMQAGHVSGVACPKCGYRRFTVVYTRQRDVGTVRVKRCRKCEQRIRTCEKVQSNSA